MANTIDKVIKIAKSEVGYVEKSASAYRKNPNVIYDKKAGAGYDNYTKYGKEMHDLYPSVMDFPAAYCDAFNDWCFQKAYGVSNAKGLIGGDFNDYTPSSAQLYKNKKAWSTTPRVGAQIFFKNSTRINHTGIVYKVDSTYVYTIEGNTSGAADVVANGGAVCKKKYKRNNSKIAGYGRPKYDRISNGTLKAPIAITQSKKEIQEFLNEYYGYEISGVLGELLDVDGSIGTKSKKALAIAYQVELNRLGADLEVDGSFGSATARAFDKYVGTLKKGVRGTIFVTLWQCVVVGYGYNPQGIDGSYGNGCVAATNKLFASKGISKDSSVSGSDINVLL